MRVAVPVKTNAKAAPVQTGTVTKRAGSATFASVGRPALALPAQAAAQLVPPEGKGVAQLTRFNVPSWQHTAPEESSSFASSSQSVAPFSIRRVLVLKEVSEMNAGDLEWLVQNQLPRLGGEGLDTVLGEVFARLLELLNGVLADLAQEEEEPDLEEAHSALDAGSALLAFMQQHFPPQEVAEERPAFAFAWPPALYANVIRRLPTKLKINGAATEYQYNEEGGLSVQPAQGREMRKREALIERGAWKNEESRQRYVLSLDGGILRDAEGRPMNGSVQYVLSADWILYGQDTVGLEQEKKRFGRGSDVHTRYLAGGPARSAGWIVVNNGVITRIGNDSGHYGPNRFMLFQLLELMRRHGVRLDRVLFHDEAVQRAHNAQEMYDWMVNGAEGPEPKSEKSKGL